MIFSYTIAGQKRLSIGVHGSREYRCGPAPHASAAQVSALVYHAKNMRGV